MKFRWNVVFMHVSDFNEFQTTKKTPHSKTNRKQERSTLSFHFALLQLLFPLFFLDFSLYTSSSLFKSSKISFILSCKYKGREWKIRMHNAACFGKLCLTNSHLPALKHWDVPFRSLAIQKFFFFLWVWEEKSWSEAVKKVSFSGSRESFNRSHKNERKQNDKPRSTFFLFF